MQLNTTQLLPTLLLAATLHLAVAAPPPQSSTGPSGTVQNARYLNLTAIGASNGRSTIECWQLTQPMYVSTDAGTAGVALQNLGDLVSTSYLEIPAYFEGGLHVAPVAQYVSFLSGLAVITLPDSGEKAVIQGGANGLIIAADTASLTKRGHITQYPSNTTTTALQLPFRDGKLPGYRILHSGQCTPREQTFTDL